CQQAYSSPRTF
nr:immunoglobulin light chain junction region [Macaca mulatta]MOW52821.1 immunoglobulin light chain junction region [Macaca mulatta]MOW53848.1 immunoglobulin light chain junction region [Macaca mulatta]MOW54178.1 immunoglobulin light chain junction region [Macaca mulatta]MOW54314.1 immunoglobulin light chain junction region [Macaca mulatta]